MVTPTRLYFDLFALGVHVFVWTKASPKTYYVEPQKLIMTLNPFYVRYSYDICK